MNFFIIDPLKQANNHIVKCQPPNSLKAMKSAIIWLDKGKARGAKDQALTIHPVSAFLFDT